MAGFPFMKPLPSRFVKQYRCYPISMLTDDKQDLGKGGKILMPPCALDLLTRLYISSPMMFKLTNERQGRMTHCGVLEFVAQEGSVHIPYWMMENLQLNQKDLIQIESVTLPVATYAKFQPQSVDFLDITNPKAVLENTLRNFACLTKGDSIAIMYNNKSYELLVLELKPKDAVSIIECDMNVEFAPPVGYVEPQAPRPQHEEEEEEITDFSDMMPEPTGFRAFACVGNSPAPVFSGEGGTSAGGATAFPPPVDDLKACEAKAAASLNVDSSQPVTNIQIRFGDGSRLVGKFNQGHTIADVRRYIQIARPALEVTPFSLIGGIPSKEVTDESSSLKDLGLVGSSLMVRNK